MPARFRPDPRRFADRPSHGLCCCRLRANLRRTLRQARTCASPAPLHGSRCQSNPPIEPDCRGNPRASGSENARGGAQTDSPSEPSSALAGKANRTGMPQESSCIRTGERARRRPDRFAAGAVEHPRRKSQSNPNAAGILANPRLEPADGSMPTRLDAAPRTLRGPIAPSPHPPLRWLSAHQPLMLRRGGIIARATHWPKSRSNPKAAGILANPRPDPAQRSHGRRGSGPAKTLRSSRAHTPCRVRPVRTDGPCSIDRIRPPARINQRMPIEPKSCGNPDDPDCRRSRARAAAGAHQPADPRPRLCARQAKAVL
jgi:hypothetical protein